MKPSEVRAAIRTRDSVDPSSHVFLKYKVKLPVGVTPEHAAVQLANSLVSGVASPLQWFAKPYEQAIVVDLVDHGETWGFEVAVPVEIFSGLLNFPQLLAIAWLPSEYGDTSRVWVEDIRFPHDLMTASAGPTIGAEGILARLEPSAGLPVLSAIVKPRFGGELSGLTKAMGEVLAAGFNAIVDDEVMYDPAGDFSFDNRVSAFGKLVAKKSTGTNSKHFFMNVMCPVRDFERRVTQCAEEGAAGVIANSFTMGYAYFEHAAELCAARDLVLIDCSIGASMMSLPYEDAGTSLELLAKLSRYAGADASHTGSQGEHWYTIGLLTRILGSLGGHIGGMKATLPVVAGGVNVANVWTKLEPFGRGCMVNLGTGLWHHPNGPAKGAEQIIRILNEIPEDLSGAAARSKINAICGRERVFAQAMREFGYEYKSHS